MEATARARSGLNFTVVSHEELHRLLQKMKFQMVRSQGSQSDPQDQSHLYLVPHKFPFIFAVSDRDLLGSDYRVARLADTIRRINTFRRVQLVRSSIPRKIIFNNLANHAGQLVGLGKFSITLHHPLSDRMIGSSRHFEFELLHNKKLQCAIIDFDGRSSNRDTSQVTLNTNCSALEICIAFAQYVKTQRFTLFFKPFNTIKASDLFYCLIKLNSSLTLKLYFLPEGPLTSSESHQLIPHKTRFILSKVQIENGSPDKDESLLSKGSFISAIRRAQQQTSDSNYRINVLRPDPLKQYLPYDSLSVKLLAELDRSHHLGHEAQPIASEPPRPQSLEDSLEAKRDLGTPDPFQFLKKNKESNSGLFLLTQTLQTESSKYASDPKSRYRVSTDSNRKDVARIAEKFATSQQTLQNIRLDAPEQASVDTTAKSQQFLTGLARNPGALPARAQARARADESIDDQGPRLVPALQQIASGFARYKYRPHAVCSRGDRTSSPYSRPSAGLHAVQKPQRITTEPPKSAYNLELDDAAIDSRQRSDISPGAILTATGHAPAESRLDL